MIPTERVVQVEEALREVLPLAWAAIITIAVLYLLYLTTKDEPDERKSDSAVRETRGDSNQAQETNGVHSQMKKKYLIKVPSYSYDEKNDQKLMEYPPNTSFELESVNEEQCFGVAKGGSQVIKWGKLGGKFNNLVLY